MIKYKVQWDIETLENHYLNKNEKFWRFSFDLISYALHSILKGETQKEGLIVNFNEYLYTIDRPTNDQFFKLRRVGIFLEEIDRKQEVKDQIVSKLADELNEIVRHKEFDDISDRLYDIISNVKEW